ncbi:MAG TPA: hypothetical protein VHA75_08720 [Rugosimonospora sp.]|nr:hypothetical protein [Rugosimonospora sp.]
MNKPEPQPAEVDQDRVNAEKRLTMDYPVQLEWPDQPEVSTEDQPTD